MKPGIHNQDKDAPVAITKMDDDGHWVREAVELCGGLKDLDPGMSVLIKPNLVVWLDKYPYAPYGVITTSKVLEEVIKLLKDKGVSNIALGDGCALNKDFGSTIPKLFAGLGYDYFEKKYGVTLVDCNDGEHEKLNIGPGPHALKVSKHLLDCDYLINVPALKTHETCRVTLGMKNLKGCLHPKTKQSCHNPQHTVDEYLVSLAERFYPNLNIIDGTYMLANGPMYTGTAQRAELIVASRDMYSVDVVGTNLMGLPVSEVEHLTRFATSQNRSTDLESIEIKGENVEDHARSIPIDTAYSADGRKPATFEKQQLEGFDLPFPSGVCTGCTYVFPPTMLLILSAIKQSPFDNYELLAEGAEPSGNAKKTFLLGTCPIEQYKDREDLQEIVKIKGCPPKVDEVAKVLTEHGINVDMAAVDKFFHYLVKRYEKSNFPKEEYWLK